jgi:hypothetical protein
MIILQVNQGDRVFWDQVTPSLPGSQVQRPCTSLALLRACSTYLTVVELLHTNFTFGMSATQLPPDTRTLGEFFPESVASSTPRETPCKCPYASLQDAATPTVCVDRGDT